MPLEVLKGIRKKQKQKQKQRKKYQKLKTKNKGAHLQTQYTDWRIVHQYQGSVPVGKFVVQNYFRLRIPTLAVFNRSPSNVFPIFFFFFVLFKYWSKIYNTAWIKQMFFFSNLKHSDNFIPLCRGNQYTDEKFRSKNETKCCENNYETTVLATWKRLCLQITEVSEFLLNFNIFIIYKNNGNRGKPNELYLCSLLYVPCKTD